MRNNYNWVDMDQLRMVSQLLRSKLMQLFYDLDIGQLFGALHAIVHVVGHQQRGLPLTYNSFSL